MDNDEQEEEQQERQAKSNGKQGKEIFRAGLGGGKVQTNDNDDHQDTDGESCLLPLFIIIFGL